MNSMIKQMCTNILNECQGDPQVEEALQKFAPKADDCLLTVQAKVLVLLHEDEITRRELVEKPAPHAGHFGPIPVLKANIFYQELHNTLVPKWISDEHLNTHDLIESARMTYLIS